MKRFLFLLSLLCCFLMQTAAQRLVVEGYAYNEQRRTPLEFAAAQLVRNDSIKIIATTDEKGYFRLQARQPGQYTLRLACIGYKTTERKITLNEQVDSIFLDSLFCPSIDRNLGMATVTATVARVEQVEDTTVFNAAAYRVPEGSTLEALVKQFPGMEVSEDGTIKWNGKQVQEFLVNGKDFFKGDTKIAMKNMPTSLVNRIKAYDKKSDYTELTGIDDGDETTVLDIITKRELNQSWISNIDLAYGTKDRYSAKLFASRFTDHTRISAFGSINNVGDRGFGGARGFGGGGNGIRTNKQTGADFAWDNGKQRREAGRMDLGGSVVYSHDDTDSKSTSSSERFLTTGGTSSFSNSGRIARTSSTNINAQFRFQWAIDSLTQLNFRPNFSYSDGYSTSRSQSATFNDDPFEVRDAINMLQPNMVKNLQDDEALRPILVNTNNSLSYSTNHSTRAGGNLMLIRRLGRSGRNINFNANGSYSTSGSRSFTLADVYYMQNVDGDKTFRNQFSTSPSKNWNYSLRAGYTEPLGGNWFGEIRYEFSSRYQDQKRSLYNLDELLDKVTGLYGSALDPYGTLYDEARRYSNSATATPAFRTLPAVDEEVMEAIRDYENSRYATYRYMNHRVNLGVRYNSSSLRFNAGVELNPEHTKLDYEQGTRIDSVLTRNVFNISPTARLRFNFSKTDMLDFNFRGSSSQPSMTDLLYVVDDSNPLSVSMGNPNLKPSWTNTLQASFRSFNVLRQQGLNAGISFSHTLRSISQRSIYDTQTGKSYSRPENITGNWNTSGNFMFNTGLGELKNFTLTTRTDVSFNNRVGWVSEMQSRTARTTYLALPRAYFAPEQADENAAAPTQGPRDLAYYESIFRNNPSTKNKTQTLGVGERLDLVYRTTYWDVQLNGTVNYEHSRASVQTRNNLDTWNYSYGATGNLKLDCGFALSTDIRVLSRRGYSDPTFNTNEVIWNAQASYSFLKGKALTLQLQAYDLLHNQSNISRAITATSRSDSWTESINSYVMFHVIYKLNVFGGKNSSGNADRKKGDRNGNQPMPTGDRPMPNGAGGYGDPRGGMGGRGGRM